MYLSLYLENFEILISCHDLDIRVHPGLTMGCAPSTFEDDDHSIIEPQKGHSNGAPTNSASGRLYEVDEARVEEFAPTKADDENDTVDDKHSAKSRSAERNSMQQSARSRGSGKSATESNKNHSLHGSVLADHTNEKGQRDSPTPSDNAELQPVVFDDIIPASAVHENHSNTDILEEPFVKQQFNELNELIEPLEFNEEVNTEDPPLDAGESDCEEQSGAENENNNKSNENLHEPNLDETDVDIVSQNSQLDQTIPQEYSAEEQIDDETKYVYTHDEETENENYDPDDPNIIPKDTQSTKSHEENYEMENDVMEETEETAFITEDDEIECGTNASAENNELEESPQDNEQREYDEAIVGEISNENLMDETPESFDAIDVDATEIPSAEEEEVILEESQQNILLEEQTSPDVSCPNSPLPEESVTEFPNNDNNEDAENGEYIILTVINLHESIVQHDFHVNFFK